MIALLLNLLIAPSAHAISNLPQEKELAAAYDKASAGHKKEELSFLAQSQDEWRRTALQNAPDKIRAYDARTAVLENWWKDSICQDLTKNPADYDPYLASGEHKTVLIGGKSLDIDLAEQGTAHSNGLSLPYAFGQQWNAGCIDCSEKILFHEGHYYDVGVRGEYTAGVRTDRIYSVTILSARGYQVPICQSPLTPAKPAEPTLTLNHDQALCEKFRDHNFTKYNWSMPDKNSHTSALPEVLKDAAGEDSFVYDGATLRADLLGVKTDQIIGRTQKSSRTADGCEKQGLAVTDPENPLKLQALKGPDGPLQTSLVGLSRELTCHNGQLDVIRVTNHDYVESQPRKDVRRLYTLKDGRAEMLCDVSTPMVREFKLLIGHGGTVTIAEPW